MLKLLSRERKRPVFSDFNHRLLGGYGFHDGIGFVPQTAVFAFAAGFTRAKFIAADLRGWADVGLPAEFMLSYGWLHQFGFVFHFRFGFVPQNGFIERVGGLVSL